MTLNLRIWRQDQDEDRGGFMDYEMPNVSPDMSFLEMLDILNERLEAAGEEPVAFEHDCREGICGSCGFLINGRPHGPLTGITVCQLHMRHFKEGQRVVLEPWRAQAFPVIRDLVVDRSAFDRIQQSGGYVSVGTGSAPEANSLPVAKEIADASFDSATCIGCGACVAACKNASAMLFTSAKVAQLAVLPQGQPERAQRVLSMVATMDAEGFGNCTNEAECEAECPKGISVGNIARMNREYLRAAFTRSD